MLAGSDSAPSSSRTSACHWLSRCRCIDLEIWHGLWEITGLVRTKKRIVVIQAQFAFTDVLVAPSPPSRACVGGHRGSTSAHVVAKVNAVSHRDGDGNFKPGLDTDTSAYAPPGQAQGAVCGTIYKTGGTEPLSPPSVGEFIVLVHDRWEVGGHRESCG